MHHHGTEKDQPLREMVWVEYLMKSLTRYPQKKVQKYSDILEHGLSSDSDIRNRKNFRLQEEFTPAPEIQTDQKQQVSATSAMLVTITALVYQEDSGRNELERVVKHVIFQTKVDADGLTAIAEMKKWIEVFLYLSSTKYF